MCRWTHAGIEGVFVIFNSISCLNICSFGQSLSGDIKIVEIDLVTTDSSRYGHVVPQAHCVYMPISGCLLAQLVEYWLSTTASWVVSPETEFCMAVCTMLDNLVLSFPGSLTHIHVSSPIPTTCTHQRFHAIKTKFTLERKNDLIYVSEHEGRCLQCEVSGLVCAV